MRNYLLYFFILVIWTTLLPFAPSLPADETESSSFKSSLYENRKLRVLNQDGEINEMTLDEYVLGVMLTEMPANYEKQALLAQAVAIRSLIVYRLETADQTVSLHPDADLCAGDDCCRSFMTYDRLLSEIGRESATARFIAASAAVYETSGEVLTYNGKTAMALYHISSPARTESYGNLFGISVPYLSGVSNIDESGFVYYKKEVRLSFDEMEALLMSGGYDYSRAADEKITAISNENLRCVYVQIGELEIEAAAFASLTGLSSTCFDVVKEENGYFLRSYGYGSGLGMSQYGANILASGGYTYKEILNFYYKDAAIEKRK